MKKILALMLAVVMAASMTVAAMAEETTAPDAPPATETPDTPETPEGPDVPETPDTPDEPVEEEAPITMNGCLPGETVHANWDITMTGTQGLMIKTDLEIKEWDHENKKDFNGKIREYVGNWEYLFSPADPLTKPEDVGKTIEDTIHITLGNGETYSFHLVVTYVGHGHIQCQNQLKVFTLGEQVVLDVKVVDPTDTFSVPYRVEFFQGTKADVEAYRNAPEEQLLLRVDEMEVIDKENFTITVTPIKTGAEQVLIHAIDENRKGYGQGWRIQVVEEGQKPIESITIPSKTDNQRAEEAAVDVIDKVNEAIAAGEELPAKAQTVETATGSTSTVVPVKLHGLEASLSVDTMDLLADGKVGIKANINNGAAEIILPNGFQHTPEPGRFGYPLGFQKDPRDAELMKSAVKEEDAKTEAYKLGGNVVLPTTATVTIKTKLEGKINVYYWNDETKKATLIASPTAADGKVTFATKQLGHLILTTGTI